MVDEILDAEERLRKAMLASDVETLDRLLSPDVLFTDHLGRLLSKEDDLESHRSGKLKIEALDLSERQFLSVGDAGVVVALTRFAGSYAGESFGNQLRFTRVWARTSHGGWWVVAAHSSLVA